MDVGEMEQATVISEKRKLDSCASMPLLKHDKAKRARKQVKETCIALPCSSGVYALSSTKTGRVRSFKLYDAVTDDLLWEDQCSVVRSSVYCPSSNKLITIRTHVGAVAKVRNLNTGYVDRISFSTNGRRFCSYSDHCIINHTGTRIAVVMRSVLEIWNLETNCKLAAVARVAHESICFTGDDTRLCGMTGRQVVVRDSENGNQLVILEVGCIGGNVARKLVSGTVGSLCAVYGDGVGVWDIKSGDELFKDSRYVQSCRFGVDDSCIVCGGHFGGNYQFIAWKIADSSVLFQTHIPYNHSAPLEIVFSGARQTYLFATRQFDIGRQQYHTEIQEYDALTGKEIATYDKSNIGADECRLYATSATVILM
jgi:hypothetical protein